MTLIWLNNAATSYPKPPCVIAAVEAALHAPPREAGRTTGVRDDASMCRTRLAALFGVDNPNQVILFPSATYALNTVIFGLAVKGGKAVTTALEHNSVLRPLAHAALREKIHVEIIRPDAASRVTPDRIAAATGPETRLVAVTHASNVTGAVQDIETIAEICAQSNTPLLIDASQSAGCVPLCFRELPGRVFVAFAGHKGLSAPPGIGGLIVPDDELAQLVVGGTGLNSESSMHPSALPMRHEAGTPNSIGIAGLAASAKFVLDKTPAALGELRQKAALSLREKLSAVNGVTLGPLPDDDGRCGIVAFNLRGFPPADLAAALSEIFEIETRGGLHCAPLVHAAIGDAPLGSVRASFGPFNTQDDISAIADAVRGFGT